MKRTVLLAALSAALLVSAPSPAQVAERVDMEMVGKIRHEAFKRSQVVQTLDYLTDTSGPRLTNSPSMTRATRQSSAAPAALASSSMNAIQKT